MTANRHRLEDAVLIARTFGFQIFWQPLPLPEVVQRSENFAGISLSALTQEDQIFGREFAVLLVVPFGLEAEIPQ
jgi:hypothetical protein